MGRANKTHKIEIPAEITLEYLAELVKQLRHSQRRHAMFRRPDTEKLCAEQEKIVDAVIARFFDGQRKLF